MQGQTVTMSSFFSDSSSLFSRSRSRSSSNVSTLSTVSTASEPSKHLPARPSLVDLPRAASFTSLPDFDRISLRFNKLGSQDLSRESSPQPSIRSEQGLGVDNGKDRPVSMGTSGRPVLEKSEKRKSFAQASRSLFSRVRGSPERKITNGKTANIQREQPAASPTTESELQPSLKRSLSKSSTFSSLARKSWMSVSRSPSPSRTIRDDSSREEDSSTTASSVSSASARNASPSRSRSRSRSTGPNARSPSPGLSLFRRNTKTTDSRKSSPNGSVRKSLTISPSRTRPKPLNPSLLPPRLLATDVPPSPKLFSKDRLPNLGLEAPKKRDELWSVFRALESDHQKFLAKTSGLKTNVVRMTLIPFLRSHTKHFANKNVNIEDVERRVVVLNKWWVGLVEMLDANNNRLLSGGDRPVILEAIAGIMSRPEWRQAPSDFAPWDDKQQDRELRKTPSGISIEESENLQKAESIRQNVRDLFIRNLLGQMTIVVEKMSMKNAPASLVSFCGKAVAYAFFFCPGVADVLLKIWAVQADTIRRVLDEFSISRKSPPAENTLDVVGDFPLHLQGFGWSSTRALLAKLRQRSTLPIEAAKIDWHGHWVTRWVGRDSDLFFVFCKYYHILLEDFIPPNLPLQDKARAPAFILVQCQLLVTLDRTLHRTSGDGINLPATFDDIVNGADASADALPLPPSSNSVRMMAENRLIMLIRDCLSERSTDGIAFRQTVAASFATIMRLAAKKTSQFDHNACFLLCDFMEEALGIYIRFQNSQTDGTSYIDWKFWLEVCQKMLLSQNSMTEIRLFSFIYGAWNTICASEERKGAVCLEWLLKRDIFQTYFLHWCPMVRAYFMRLICWRLCRHNGETTKTDTKVLAAVSNETKFIWANYLHMKRLAKRDKKALPSTAPCLPAPGRRLLIIRMDTQAAASNIIVGLDSILQKRTSSAAVILPRKSSTNKTTGVTPVETRNDQDVKLKKRWSLSSRSNSSRPSIDSTHSRSKSSSTLTSKSKAMSNMPEKDLLDKARSATAAARSRPSSIHQSKISSSSSDSGPPSPNSSSWRAFSFKFSLEWHANPQTHAAFQHQSQQAAALLKQPRTNNDFSYVGERRLNPPRLPAPAHSWLVSQVPGTADEITAKAPRLNRMAQSIYAGRALAEWTLIILECNNFILRRRSEGVPTLQQVEVPGMGVEGFRKLP